MPRPTPDSQLVAGVLTAAALTALAVDAFLLEPTRIEISRQELPLPGLPADWEGAGVLHVTDLHWGNVRSHWLMRWLVETARRLEPDLIVFTGDFVQGHSNQAPPCAGYLAQMDCPRGMVGVLGDHDFRDRPARPREGLEAAIGGAGIRLLRNEAVELPGGLRIAGVDPTTPKLPLGDVPAALDSLPGGPPHLLLAHSPDILPEAARLGIAQVLCGHTHGGQVVLPFIGPPLTHTRVSRRHARGWSTMGRTRAYTCRGLSSHWSLRFLCPPEVVLFTLRNAS